MVLDDLKKLPDEQVIEIVRKRLMELKKENQEQVHLEMMNLI